MKPELYSRYHEVYDRFSSVKLFPIFITFCQKVHQNASRNTTAITDVGAGTGLFTSLLAGQFSGAKISLIEPSEYMMPYARARLSESKIDFYESSLEQTLMQIQTQDIFIFQRSLYALSGDIGYYKRLANQLSEKISENGLVGIFEIGQLYDIPITREYFQSNRKVLRLSENEFEKQWLIFEQALKDFNHGAESGDYMLFNKDNLNEIFSHKFSLIDGDNRNIFIYRKKTG